MSIAVQQATRLLIGFLLSTLAAFYYAHQQASGLLYFIDKLRFVGPVIDFPAKLA